MVKSRHLVNFTFLQFHVMIFTVWNLARYHILTSAHPILRRTTKLTKSRSAAAARRRRAARLCKVQNFVQKPPKVYTMLSSYVLSTIAFGNLLICLPNFVSTAQHGKKGFLLRQLRIVNYYIKCLSNNCWFLLVYCFFYFKTKQDLKCQNELFLKYHFSGNTSVYVFITEIIWPTFDVIIDNP